MFNFILFLTCSVCFNALYLTSALQCLDENDNPVDWYILYKLPKQKTHPNFLVQNGVSYIYLTSSNYSAWTSTEIPINSTKSIPARTLNDLFDLKNRNMYSFITLILYLTMFKKIFFNQSKKNLLYIHYNDQPPEGTAASSYGHLKGVVLANEKQGIWLIHSVPKFPYSLDEYIYPSSGETNGQSFLCITMDIANLNAVGLQLQYNHPFVYAQNVPEALKDVLPELAKAANKDKINVSPYYNVQDLKSKSGIQFKSFAKSAGFDADLYADLVSTQLEIDLFVETWPNEANRLPSDCGKQFEVDNVQSISISEIDITFTSTVDHSKWAVSATQDIQKWICIGDINRAESQKKRGGGTTCLQNEKIATHYENIVASLQGCENIHNKLDSNDMKYNT